MMGKPNYLISQLLPYYIEDKIEIRIAIRDASRSSVYTEMQFIEGLLEINKSQSGTASIHVHLDILGRLANVGVQAGIAGQTLCEALIKSAKKDPK